jgi:plastocyanin
MICRSLICSRSNASVLARLGCPERTERFRHVFAVSLLVAAVTAQAATVGGTITLVDSKDPVVRKSGDRSGVVVWLEPVKPVDQGHGPTSTKKATITQKGKRFSPHVLAVQVGTEVSFPNFDPIFHNAFSTFDGQIFDVGLYPPGTTRIVHFRRAGVVRVFCNIHHEMSAIIVVLPVRWFASSSGDGTFSIGDVPPGEYILSVFHERATEANLLRLRRRIRVESPDSAHDVGRISISEAGYLPVPHRNKYGREYDPNADRSYIGLRK